MKKQKAVKSPIQQNQLKQVNHNKSKQQLKAEMVEQQNVNRLRILVREQVYPLLLKNSKSVHDAKRYMEGIQVYLRQALNDVEMNMTVESLNVRGEIAKMDGAERYLELFDVLKDEKLQNAFAVLGGFTEEINQYVDQENKTKPLTDLNIKLL